MSPLLLFTLFAAAMASFGAFVIWLGSRSRRRFDRALVLVLVAMMVSMSGGALLYETLPPLLGIEIAIFLSMWIMVAGIGYLVGQLLEPENAPPPTPRGLATFRGIVIAGGLGTEAMLGLALALASGSFALRGGPGVALAALLTSAWFLLPMTLEMALSFLLIRKELPTFAAALLGLQPALMALSPTLAPAGSSTALVVAGGAVMTVLFVLIMEYFTRHRSLQSGVFGYVTVVLGVYAVMMAGLFLWQYDGNPALFALSVVLEMVLFFDAVLSPTRFQGEATVVWDLKAGVVFGIILLVFVAEFFMGATFDLALDGRSAFLALLPNVPAGPTLATSVGPWFLEGIFFVTTVLGSSWFLLMMGLEMGALIVFKMLGTRSRETRVRLGLVLGAFFLYTLYLPAFYFAPDTLRWIPMVGWSMGFGTGGGFFPPLLFVLLATYAISAVLSLLFGARQLCSGLCSAALMYQGSFYDSLKTFNRRSPVGRKLLGSRISRLYGAVFSLSWASITVAAVLSYLNHIGTIQWTVYGEDVAYFTYVLYFDLLWYLVFVSIPFVGTYACVSSGYCYWGTFNQLLGRLGFFRLKARDPATCVACTTKPCTKACPVGLTDLPAGFIKNGEFRALKCIGVGDCVESCPYDNILFWDVRHWLRDRLGHGRREAPSFPAPRKVPGSPVLADETTLRMVAPHR